MQSAYNAAPIPREFELSGRLAADGSSVCKEPTARWALCRRRRHQQGFNSHGDKIYRGPLRLIGMGSTCPIHPHPRHHIVCYRRHLPSSRTCVLLKDRVPNSGPTWENGRRFYPKVQTALQDAQRTLGMVRLRAAQWQVDPHKVGVIGFSAGGHLVAAVSTHFAKRTYPPADDARQGELPPGLRHRRVPRTPMGARGRGPRYPRRWFPCTDLYSQARTNGTRDHSNAGQICGPIRLNGQMQTTGCGPRV